MLQSETVKKYDTYKDSGIEWIGEIPTTWQKVRLRFLCNIQTGDKDTVNKVDDGMYPFYVRSPIVERINTYTFDGEAILTAGDGVGAGKVFHYVTGKFDYHQRVYNLHNFKRIFGKFLYLYLKENFYKEIEKSNAKSTVDSIRLPMLLDFPVVFPVDTVEQQVIADYLDKKCGEIDKVVETEKAVIERLKEYKQSVITEAVTKGLDKSVPLKNSGIEWIGKIPQHWEVGKIKHKFHLSSDINDDENATLLSLFTHIGVKPRAEMEDKGNKAQTVLGYSLVKKDDIIVNKLLAWMGAIGLSSYNGATSPDYDIYRLRNIQDDCPMFYHYLFRSCNFKDECYKYGRGIMLMRLRTYPEEFLNIYIPIILQDEQENIVNYLNQKCSEIDKVISDKEQLIEKLTEYKKSLIYECVTGKRKVVE